VAAFIDRSLVKLQRCFVAVETQGELTAGETLGYGDGPIRQSAPKLNAPADPELNAPFVPNANVAIDVDSARFFQMFVDRLSGRSPKPLIVQRSGSVV